MNLYIVYLALIMPGFLSEWIWEQISKRSHINNYQRLVGGLIFNLPILMINLFVVYVLKAVTDFSILAYKFTFVRFTIKYILLALAVSIVIGLIVGIVGLICRKKKCKADDACSIS